MPKASYQQANFLGGEWSPAYQGRVDNPRYKTAMNLSSNGYPTEEGAWIKRSGFRDLMPTRAGAAGRLFRFSVNPDTPYEVELTDGHLRVLNGDTPVLDSTAGLLAISPSTPVQIAVDGNGAGWATGDTIVFSQTAGIVGAYGGLPNQQMTLTQISTQVFTLTDAATGASIDGSQLNVDPTAAATVGRILDFAAPWTGTDWYQVKTTMVNNQMFLFHSNYAPYILTLSVSGWSFSIASFLDGPFLDPVSGQTAVLSATSGTVTVTLTGGFGPNQSVPTAQDVGRLMRFFNEPNAWDAGTTYALNDPVNYQEAYFIATAASVPAGSSPSSAPQYWAQSPGLAQWIWGIIDSYVGPTQVTLTLQISSAFGPELYANTINTWQLGKFGDPIVNGVGYGFPVCGTFHEGRLWIFAANSIDGSVANQPTVFSATQGDGTVTDVNAISYVLEAGDDNSSSILWAKSTASGIVLGSNGGEWLIQASALNDPITPTSIQAKRVTKYRCSYVMPVSTPLSIVFVQRFQRKVMELLQDVFTGRYVAPNLTTAARHLTTEGIEEIVYQDESTPIVWMRDLAGALRGVTYRRQSAFPSEEPVFTGWHRHSHGEPGRLFNSLCMSPAAADVRLDYLYAVTSNANTAGTYRVQRMAKQFGEDDVLAAGFFLYGGVVPNAMVDQGTGVLLYGAYAHAGQTVHVVLGGVDMGTFTVDSIGRVTVPYTATVNAAYLQSLAGQDLGEAGSSVAFTVNTTPVRSNTPTTIGNFAGSGVGPSADQANYTLTPDFANNRLITITGAIGTDWYITSYNLSTRAQIAQTSGSTLFTVALDAPFIATMSTDGYLLLQMDNEEVDTLVKVNPANMSVVASMGTTSNSPTSLQDNLWESGGNAVCSIGGVPCLVTVAATATTNAGQVQVARTDTMHTLPCLGVSYLSVSSSALVCRGLSAATINSVYFMEPTSTALATLKQFVATSAALTFIDTTQTWSGTTTYGIGAQVVYQGTLWTSKVGSNLNNSPQSGTNWTLDANPYADIITLGTIAPTAIDAAWSHIAIVDMGFDRTDQNLIVVVKTSDSVTHTKYMAKINPANCQVLWATPIAFTNLPLGLANARIIGGRMGWLNDSGTLSIFNTSTGAIVTTVSMSPDGAEYATYGTAQLIDAVSANFYARFNYDSSTTGAATPLSGTPSTFNEWGVFSPGNQLLAASSTITNYSAPAIIGFDYSPATQGQLLRVGSAQEAGAANGPPQGKKRRTNQFAALFENTQAVSVGTDFSHLKPITFASTGSVAYAVTSLFSGTWWDTLSDDFSYDSMLAWQSTGAYPLTIVSISGFLETQDY